MKEKLAPVVMVMGTASSVGKSMVVTGLCRLFARLGYNVAPFKAQNMALNSFVTPDGKEIGRAQAVQAEAAGVVPTAEMNPVLLKPEGDRTSQVVVMGRVVDTMNAAEYHQAKPNLRNLIREALQSLRREYDLVVIEGAGSPAEVNLKSQDIVNMFVALEVKAPVLLVGDIDRGGVFASFVGTMALLEPEEQELSKGFVINKFRGDLSLLLPGYDILYDRTGVPVLGTLPYLKNLRVSDEDSLALDHKPHRKSTDHSLDIAIIRLPRISNYDEFETLEHEPGVWVRYVTKPHELQGAHLIIVPGSKKTLGDLDWMESQGLAAFLKNWASMGKPILGICGGCQILGHEIADPEGVEGDPRVRHGLGLIPLRTHFAGSKITAQVQCELTPQKLWGDEVIEGVGYEIHMGRVFKVEEDGEFGAVKIRSRGSESVDIRDGGASKNGLVVGSLVHGLLDRDQIRHGILNQLRRMAGLAIPKEAHSIQSRSQAFELLANEIESSLDIPQLKTIIGLEGEDHDQPRRQVFSEACQPSV